MEFVLQIGKLAVKEQDRSIDFEGGEIKVAYTEKEFVLMVEKYPTIVAAIFEQFNNMAEANATSAINRAKRKESTS